MKIFKTILTTVAIALLLYGCSGNNSARSSSTITPTAPLAFNHSSIAVTKGSSRDVVLTLYESGISGLHVAINSTNTAVATVSPGECVLSSESAGAPTSCVILVRGITDGNANITATATGFTVTPVAATVQDSPVPGSLVFNTTSQTVTAGSTNYVTISLIDSSGVSDLAVALGSTNTGVATVTSTPNPCILSSGESHTCEVTITGLAAGNTNITASATGYSVTPVATTVTNTPVAGTISFSTTTVSVSPNTSSQVLLSLNNSSGVENLQVSLSSNSSFATESPSSCSLSSGSISSRSCTVTITGVASGSTQVTATASGYSILPVNVSIADPTSFSRTFTIYNNTSGPIWIGSTGGATDSIKNGVDSGATSCGISNPGATCPSGSTCLNAGIAGYICYFNPLIATNNSLIESGQSAIIGVPSTSYDPGNDFVWSGNIFARQQCTESGYCIVANCNTVNGGTDMTCTAGAQPPVTLVEITMLRKNPDSYDLSLENGMNVASKFGPNNATYTSSQIPYNCGIAGNTESITSAGFTIPASSWVFSPSGFSIGSPQPTAANFTWVSGDGNSNPSCPCTLPDVCGYTTNAVQSLGGLAPVANYKLSCGQPLGYFAAAEIWFLNQNTTTNLAPFAFGQSYGASPYNNATLFTCATPPLYTGNAIVAGQNESNTCGSTNWTGIAAPKESYAISNPNWLAVILPNITWTKQGCPSCYSFPYDDQSSSYTCDNVTAGSDNPPNSTNYNVTFTDLQ